jgi:hypothetical protein
VVSTHHSSRTQLGLLNNILASLINGLSCQAVALLWLNGLGQPWWQRSEAARLRRERDGFYALMPAYVTVPLGLAGMLLAYLISHPLFIAAIHWGATAPLQAPSWGGTVTLHMFSSSRKTCALQRGFAGLP